MAGNATPQFGEFVGVSDVYIASITTDDSTAYTAGTPEYLAPVASVAIEPNVSTKNRYYDNKAYFASSSEGETKITFVFSGIPLATAAKLLGKHYDTTAKRMYDDGSSVKAPYLACGFAAEVEGGCKYYWFLKGKFAPWSEAADTQTNEVNEKTVSVVYSAVVTAHSTFDINGVASPCKRVIADDRLDNTVTKTTWFASVQKPSEYSAG